MKNTDNKDKENKDAIKFIAELSRFRLNYYASQAKSLECFNYKLGKYVLNQDWNEKDYG